MQRLVFLCLALLIGFGFGTGCNVFEGFHEEGTSNDPEVLLQDAELALRSGEPQRAVQYLERALERNPGNLALRNDIRFTLSKALMQANDISVLTLEELTTTLIDQLDAHSPQAVGAYHTNSAEVCSFDESGDVRGGVVNLDTDTFRRIRDKVVVLDRVIELLMDAFQFEDMTPEGITAGIDRLRAQGVAEQRIQAQLFVLAVAHVARAYIDVAEAGLDQVTWYQVIPSQGGSAYLGFCAPSQEVIDALRAATNCAVEELRTAVRLMEARVEAFDLADTPAGDFAEDARDAYDRLAVELGGGACVR